MSAGTPILLERDNVNDDTVILSQWFAKNGEHVEEGALIAEVETSKASVEVMAPHAGFLEWAVKEKADLPYTAPLGHIHEQAVEAAKAPEPEETERVAEEAFVAEEPSSLVGDVAETPPPSMPAAPAPTAPAASAAPAPAAPVQSFPANPSPQPAFSASTDYAKRRSRRAEELIRKNGLSEEQFAGLSMVRAADVLRVVQGGSPQNTPVKAQQSAPPPVAEPQPAEPQPAASSAAPPPRQPAREVPLSRMKRSEAQALGAGTRNAIPSSVSVACPTRGLRSALQRNPIVGGNVGAVIVFETARLLRKYPAFNATYRPGSMMQYEQVNVGYAMDDGRGLKVAVLQDCDTKSLAQISEELRNLVLAYLDNKLTPAQIGGGTFTISDLSGIGVASFLPLISEDQGAILGVGGEQFLPGSREGSYTLTLAFDHQLSEGRTAALFLNDLKSRLMHYEQAMGKGSAKEDPACARCGRTAVELPDAKSFMVQSIVPPGYLCNLCVVGL